MISTRGRADSLQDVPRKPTLAVWKFASCDGCQLSLLDLEDELLALAGAVEFAEFHEATSRNVEGPYDLSLVEGSVTTAHDAERIQQIRSCSRRLITIGACATAGGVQALRNFADVEEFTRIVYASPQYISTLATSTPISAHVKVDFELRGCPINKRQLLEVVSAFLRGRKPGIPSTSVCTECKRRGTVCVTVAHGTPCLGPVTHAGCGALCPAYNRGCFGCFGPMETPNTRALIGVLHRDGLDSGAVQRIFQTFNAAAPEFRAVVTMTERRTIRTDYLARVEGEGALTVELDGERVERVELRIFEPPRFFEALLRGRSCLESPDITARICGICPVAYQTSAINAIENLCVVEVPEPIRILRRLLYCGEWIESHALHIYMLHAPDFLGYTGAVELAREHPQTVERGLKLKASGNELMRVIGGREVHPINVRVGGFYRAPSKKELSALVEPLERAREAAIETVRWTAGFEFPQRQVECELVALHHPEDYAIERGRIISDAGLDIAAADYDEHFEEEHVERSTALHSHLRQRGTYLCGPLARYSLNHAQLSPLARQCAGEAGLGSTCRDPFRSIIVRSVELVYACDEALRLISAYEPPQVPAIPVEPRAGTGYGVSEAPRGMLYHRYRVDAAGTILDAKIVPPTSQNQQAIEDDLRGVVGAYLELDDDHLRALCEQTIRNYDPCISCATHFLRLEVNRR